MQTLIKCALAAFLLSATTQVCAEPIPCPSPAMVAQYANNFNAIQLMSFGPFGEAYVVLSGMKELETIDFYDRESQRKWRHFTSIAGDGQLGFNTAYLRAIEYAKNVTVRKTNFADDGNNRIAYLCEYASSEDIDCTTTEGCVVLFSERNNNNGRLDEVQLLRGLMKRFGK